MAGNYKSAPDWKDLDFIRNKTTKETFSLAGKIGTLWESIGSRIGLEPNRLDSIKTENYSDKNRLRVVMLEWIANASGLTSGDSERYALSWQGLYNLLEDCGRVEDAKKFFIFLGRMPTEAS